MAATAERDFRPHKQSKVLLILGHGMDMGWSAVYVALGEDILERVEVSASTLNGLTK